MRCMPLLAPRSRRFQWRIHHEGGQRRQKRKRRRAKSAPTDEEKEDENSEEAKFDAWTRSLELEKYNDFCPGEGSSSTAAPVELSPEKVASLKAPPRSVLCPSTPPAKKTESGSRGFAGASCIAQGGIAKGGIGNAKEKGGVTKEKGGATKEKGGARKSKGLHSELPGQQQLFPGAW